MAGVMDLVSLKGRTRQANVSGFLEQVEDVPAINNRGEFLANQCLPPKTELARLGQSWSVRTLNASVFNLVAAMPTTLATLVLYNGEPQGTGKSYVLESAWALNLVTITAAASLSLVGQHVPAATAPTDLTTLSITSRNGKTYAGSARKAVNQTTMTANQWELLATSINSGSATATVGLAVIADLQGAWILRPGDMFGVGVIGGTATAASMVIGFSWHEVSLPVF